MQRLARAEGPCRRPRAGPEAILLVGLALSLALSGTTGPGLSSWSGSFQSPALPHLESSQEHLSGSSSSTMGGSLTWTSVGPPSGVAPVARCCSGLSIDPTTGGLLLFGGIGDCGPCGDTWQLLNGVWENLSPGLSVSPAGRSYASLVFDPAEGGVLLFGGLKTAPPSVPSTALGDTWLFLAGHWQQLHPLESPPARWAAGMVYDPTLGAVVLFGGYSPSAGFLGDTWKFANGSWSPMLSLLSPSPRWAPALAEDPEQGGVLLFGGYSPSQGVVNDSWLLDGNEWSPLTLSVAPSAREKAMMAFDPSTSSLLLFGGLGCGTSGCQSAFPSAYLNDTWSFQNGAWTNLTASVGAAPSQRCCGELVYDPFSATLLLEQGTGFLGNLPAQPWSLSLRSHGPIAVVSAATYPPVVVVGQFSTLEVGVAGNEGPVSYVYSNLPPGCVSSNVSDLACAPQVAGNFSIGVLVRDQSGNASGTTLLLQALASYGNSSLAPAAYGFISFPYAGWSIVGALGAAAAVAWLWKRPPARPKGLQPPSGARGVTPTRTGRPSREGNASEAAAGRGD